MIDTRYLLGRLLPAAFSLLPPRMLSPQAEVLLLAIGWQESRFAARKQRGGPALGFWMFEAAGVRGVLEHPATRALAAGLAARLCYEPSAEGLHLALRHNDALACAFARLLLWTDPEILPRIDQRRQAWDSYLATWRPGRPRPETWTQAHDWARTITSGG